MTSKCIPPYPRLGELLRAFAVALDSKCSDRNLDRLAREGDYDGSLLDELKAQVTGRLQKITDDEFAGFISQFVNFMHEEYRRLITRIPLDSLSRDEALPLLIEHFFVPHGADFLLKLKKAFGGPDPMALLDPAKQPIAAALNWFDQEDGRGLARMAFPESAGTDRGDRELIARWAQGEQMPDLQSISRLTQALIKRGGAEEGARVPNLRRWLVVARTLSWLGKKTPSLFQDSMCWHLACSLPENDIELQLSSANIKAGERLSALKEPALLLYEDLKQTTPKRLGDQVHIRNRLDTFQQLCREHDPEERTRFRLEWLLGRWHALSGQFDMALHHYEEAARLADYRAGDQQKEIIEETLVLAAFVGGKKALLKSLKHRAIALGLFNDPSGGRVIEGWEVNHLRQHFYRVFPLDGRFPEAQDDGDDQEVLPFLLLDRKDIDRIEPDLRKPDRVRTVRATDGQKRYWPQLRLFASVGRADAVQDLLKHGASVDQLDEAGGSALLCAIQHAEQTGERRVLDLLLERTHKKATLDSVTTRKRHTLLICAIHYGEPDVVGRLLEMGATPDQRGQIDGVTPLYRCLCSIGAIRKPLFFYHYLRNSFRADPDHVQREVRRRYDIRLGGVFGDEHTLHDLSGRPEYQDILHKLALTMMEEEIGRLSVSKLLGIVERLLKTGANPNAVHEYPARGRTPLMLAAENDSLEAFELMMRHHGDPYQKDAQGMNCTHIAYTFKSGRIVGYLRRIGVFQG